MSVYSDAGVQDTEVYPPLRAIEVDRVARSHDRTPFNASASRCSTLLDPGLVLLDRRLTRVPRSARVFSLLAPGSIDAFEILARPNGRGIGEPEAGNFISGRVLHTVPALPIHGSQEAQKQGFHH